MAISRLGCLGAGVAEIWVPGVGYVLTRQWDKAAVLGGTRWIAGNKAYNAYESDYYQDDADDIYKTVEKKDSLIGKQETRIYMNKETWTVQYYGSIDFNLLMTTWGDLYRHGCRPNREIYSLMLSPLRFDLFYDKWAFWVPIVFLLGNNTILADSDDEKVTYYLKRGLTESDLRNDSFSKYYLVGVGEEMFFRGTVQHYFFSLFKDTWGFSPSASRHFSVLGASAVFAAAHDGSGFTASPLGAFLFGIYEGYFVYHPTLDQFDLTTAIAL
ncbi:MAG: CPBP family intramembrane metalloprotease, partial [Proteobacteria bacterium]|nr:CPBP family intramembrane metalloprotease [Pseudomonadota bacterium]